MNKFIPGFLLFYMGILYAQPITQIEIDGLYKTHGFVVEDIIGLNTGEERNGMDEEKIRQKLIQSGLFINETISVQFSEIPDGLLLSIYLEDRHSLIPIPMVFYNGSSGVTAGLFVVDKNLMGLGHTMVFGGLFNNDKTMIMTEFTDKSIKGSTFDLGFGLAYDESEELVTSVDEENEILVYDRQIFTAGPKVSWNYDPFKLSFSPSVGFLDTSAYDDSVLMISNEIKTEYTSLFYHNFFPEGFEAELVYENIYYADNYNSTNSVLSGFSLKKTVGEKLQFQWNADGGYYSGEEWMALEPGKGMSGSILPDTVYADYFLRSGISLQMAVVDFNWGFISLPLSYQLGMLDGISGENELFHGPSFGAALYLKKIAFPAVKVNYSYNIESGTGTFTASIGISH